MYHFLPVQNILLANKVTSRKIKIGYSVKVFYKNFSKKIDIDNHFLAVREPEVIFIAGGWTSRGSTEVLDLDGNCSFISQSLPDGRESQTAHLVDQGSLLLLCGGGDGATRSSCIGSRRPAEGKWTEHSSLRRQRRYHSGTVAGDPVT